MLYLSVTFVNRGAYLEAASFESHLAHVQELM